MMMVPAKPNSEDEKAMPMLPIGSSRLRIICSKEVTGIAGCRFLVQLPDRVANIPNGQSQTPERAKQAEENQQLQQILRQVPPFVISCLDGIHNDRKVFGRKPALDRLSVHQRLQRVKELRHVSAGSLSVDRR